MRAASTATSDGVRVYGAFREPPLSWIAPMAGLYVHPTCTPTSGVLLKFATFSVIAKDSTEFPSR